MALWSARIAGDAGRLEVSRRCRKGDVSQKIGARRSVGLGTVFPRFNVDVTVTNATNAKSAVQAAPSPQFGTGEVATIVGNGICTKGRAFDANLATFHRLTG